MKWPRFINEGKSTQGTDWRGKVEAIMNAGLQTRPRDASNWSVRTMVRVREVSAATNNKDSCPIVWTGKTSRILRKAKHRTETVETGH